jgi:methyl-accepting chemotaxis protein
MLHRLSIRERLVAAFGFLLLAFGGLGAFSVERMESVNAAAAAISDRWLPAIQVLGQLDGLMSELRLDVLNHVTSTDPARARRLEADMEQVQARLGAVRTTYAATITLPEERRLFEAVAQAQDLYTRQVPTIIGLSRDGQQAAAQTAKATEQIGAQIATMQAETRGAVDAIRAITSTIGQVDNITVQVAAAAEEQASATQEIVRAVAEAATGTREVSRYTGELLQGATATGQAAAQVGASSGALTQRSVLLRQQVDRFLAGIRAA